MNFNLTEEQQMLQDSLRRFVTNEYDFDKRRKMVEAGTGTDATVWQAFAEMGLLGFTFPEDYEGLGGNAVDTMLVMDCFGRALVVEPYLATVVLAGGVIRDFGSDAQKRAILPKIASGEHLMALAHSEPGARYHLHRVSTSAEKTNGGFVLNGEKTGVLHGGQAHQLVVSARTKGAIGDRDGISLFLVDLDAEGVKVDDMATHDGHRSAEITFNNVKVNADALVGKQNGALPAIEKAFDLGIAAVCAEAVGAMEALNKTTNEYIKQRKQFGVQIGKFQVLQHRMVDMFIAAEEAKSMAILAASDVNSEDAAVRRKSVSMAKVRVGQCARTVGQGAVQLHGGMGVVDEMFAAHLFKRLTLIGLLFGDEDWHLGLAQAS